MKSPAELKADALKRTPGDMRPLTRVPRTGSECYFMERDKNGQTYSVFCVKTLAQGSMHVTLILDGALYQGARECVLKHTVEANARAIEMEYGVDG